MKFFVTHHYGSHIITQVVTKFAIIGEDFHGETTKGRIVFNIADLISITRVTRRS